MQHKRGNRAGKLGDGVFATEIDEDIFGGNAVMAAQKKGSTKNVFGQGGSGGGGGLEAPKNAFGFAQADPTKIAKQKSPKKGGKKKPFEF